MFFDVPRSPNSFFFFVLGTPFSFLDSRVVPLHEFDASWELFLNIFVRLLDFLEESFGTTPVRKELFQMFLTSSLFSSLLSCASSSFVIHYPYHFNPVYGSCFFIVKKILLVLSPDSLSFPLSQDANSIIS